MAGEMRAVHYFRSFLGRFPDPGNGDHAAMSIFDKVKDKVSEVAQTHGDKLGQALDKGADVVNRRTQGKHAGKVEGLAGRAKRAIEDLGEQPPGRARPDDGPPSPPPPAP